MGKKGAQTTFKQQANALGGSGASDAPCGPQEEAESHVAPAALARAKLTCGSAWPGEGASDADGPKRTRPATPRSCDVVASSRLWFAGVPLWREWPKSSWSCKASAASTPMGAWSVPRRRECQGEGPLVVGMSHSFAHHDSTEERWNATSSFMMCPPTQR